MAFEGLSEKLSNAFKKLKNKGKLSENDVKEAMREVRLALLEADVNYKVAKELTAKITERAVGQDVMESLTPGQMVVKIVNEELTELMGGDNARIEFASKPPTVIMLCGLQGSGKTTHAAKLALMLKNQNHRPLLVACDIYRPAAIDQLKVVGAKAGVPVFERGTQNPVKTAKEAIRNAKDYGNDVVILDTAGRLHIEQIGYVYASDISPRVKYKLARKNMYFSNNPSVVMISYMFVAETELMNIITLIEGTRYKLDSKKIQSLLIV